jgi:hypothetical protein
LLGFPCQAAIMAVVDDAAGFLAQRWVRLATTRNQISEVR